MNLPIGLLRFILTNRCSGLNQITNFIIIIIIQNISFRGKCNGEFCMHGLLMGIFNYYSRNSQNDRETDMDEPRHSYKPQTINPCITKPKKKLD